MNKKALLQGSRAQSGLRRDTHPDLETLAVQALGFLAADEERLQRFLGLTGFDPAGLRQAVEEPGFSRSVMAYVCQTDALVSDFARHVGRSPDAIGRLVQWEAERDEGSLPDEGDPTGAFD